MKLPLVCLPFAGAGASVFRPWRDYPADSFEVVPVQLPGREELFIEDPYTSLAEAAAGTAERILAAVCDRPYALFGHSFGALLAHATVQLLHSKGLHLPERLIISGAAAPWLPRPHIGVAALTDEELASRVRELVGYDHEAFHDPELRELVVPALRADMTINESPAATEPTTPLPVPISVLRGTEDELITRADALQWTRATNVACELIDVPGEHMYFSTDWPKLWNTIDELLDRGRRARRPS
ncbi:thioesterase II family protein [Streptomyces sp. V3I7]|uniref:thioesterase II family protein n=1 Tax=Streptomyces sp. V3I7 TaxID=3042278 RepID=UPI00278190BA|nr:alpha/beta fold hydrolase [Streptomyces sp. V3I7]MDQ0989121.1 surfactin synthase thioesterase subunit [Streptomyces sp. V3I7]